MRRTPFSPGRRWHCVPEDKAPFDFVVLGPGTQPLYKRCRIEVEGHDPARLCGTLSMLHRCFYRCSHGLEQDYSHKHLKKYATLIEDTP